MKLSITEILRRGFESMLANWPLLVIRIVESIVLIIMMIVAVVAVIVPIAVSFGAGSLLPSADPGDVAGLILTTIAAHIAMILYLLGLITVVLTVWIVVHSFVVAGSARIYVDSMQRTAASAVPTRAEMGAFTADRWFQGGKAAWWSVFWIYNIAWAIAFVIILVPFVIFAGLVVLLRENGPVAMVAGCSGLFLLFIFVLPVAVITGICTQKAIVDCLARGTGAMDSLRAAWREFRADLGRHLAVAVVMVVASFGVAMVVGSMSMFTSFGHHAPGLMMIPMQFSSSILNSIFGAAVGAWFLACFAALAVERR